MQRLLFFLLLLMPLGALGDWELQRKGGRDYVSLENIADFYGMGVETPDGPTFVKNRKLSNSRHALGLQIGSREVQINGVRQWLSFPVVEENGKLLVSRIDLAKTIEPMLRPEKIRTLEPIQTVVLDPGHGGHDRGAVNRLGDEKTYTLDVALRMKPMLEALGLKVVMTRDRDIFIPLEERAAIANRTPNSIFVSIHFNAGGPHANGFEIFTITPRGAPSTADSVLRPRDFREEPGNSMDEPSSALAASVYHSMLGHFSDFDRGVKRARFAVIRLARVPSILVEGGFISNKEDAESIHSAAWRQTLAAAMARGISSYKSLAANRGPLELVADYRHGYGRPMGQLAMLPKFNESDQGDAAPDEEPETLEEAPDNASDSAAEEANDSDATENSGKSSTASLPVTTTSKTSWVAEIPSADLMEIPFSLPALVDLDTACEWSVFEDGSGLPRPENQDLWRSILLPGVGSALFLLGYLLGRAARR